MYQNLDVGVRFFVEIFVDIIFSQIFTCGISHKNERGIPREECSAGRPSVTARVEMSRFLERKHMNRKYDY